MRYILISMMIFLLSVGHVFAYPVFQLNEQPSQSQMTHSFYQILFPYANKNCDHLFDINRQWLKNSTNRSFKLNSCNDMLFGNSRKGIFEQQMIYEKKMVELLTLQSSPFYNKKKFQVARKGNEMLFTIENYYQILLKQNPYLPLNQKGG